MTAVVAMEMNAQSAFLVAMGPHQYPFSSVAMIATGVLIPHSPFYEELYCGL